MAGLLLGRGHGVGGHDGIAIEQRFGCGKAGLARAGRQAAAAVDEELRVVADGAGGQAHLAHGAAGFVGGVLGGFVAAGGTGVVSEIGRIAESFDDTNSRTIPAAFAF